jgi:hypothetical protein
VRATNFNPIVTHVYGKGEVHNNPDHRSGNEHFILDAFYSNSHNLKASFMRLTSNDLDYEALKQYYRTHEEEVLAGADSLLDALNDILETGNACDQTHGTHFKFLVESILFSFEEALFTIGFSKTNAVYAVNGHIFYTKLSENPEIFEFLYKQPNGLIEMLSKVYYKIMGVTSASQTEGRIIDFRT